MDWNITVTTLSTVMVAIATVALVIVTWAYVRITHKLVRLQIEPSVECGFESSANGRTRVVLKNAGAEPVVNVKVDTRFYFFLDPNRPPIFSHTNIGIPPGHDEAVWWKIPRLSPGELQSRDATEEINRYFHNQAAAEAQSLVTSVEGAKPIRTDFRSLVVFDVAYQREVDHRLYQISRSGFIFKERDSGKPLFLDIRTFSDRGNLKQVLKLIQAPPPFS